MATSAQASVQQRALSAVASLLLREAAVRALNLVVAVLLARMLGPAVLGEFALASFAVAAVGLCGDLGLNAALIRQRETPCAAELGAAASLQVLWTAILVMLTFIAAPALAALLGGACPPALIRVLSLGLLARSPRLVPAALAERRLAYGRIAIAEAAEQAVYAALALALACAGFAVWSFAIAAVVGVAAGTTALLAATGRPPAFRWDVRPAIRHLRFGIAFQGQAIAHFVKDTIIPSVGGRAYGPAAVGYLSWAHDLAALPLVLTHLVSRVGYPALSQLQDDRDAMRATLEGMLRWIARLSFPAFATIVGLGPEIIRYVLGPQWLPALPALWWYSANMALGVGTGVLLPVLYVTGRERAGLRLSLGWAACTLVCSLGLVRAGAGFTGLAAAQTLGTALALVAVMRELRGVVGAGAVFADIRVPALSGGLVLAALHVAAPMVVQSLWSLGMAAASAAGAALAANLLEEPAQLRVLLTRLRGGHRPSAAIASRPAAGSVVR